ncbi:MAG: flavin oxidoreductase/NADH oxidase [Clostridia bacterium]|nr:flavin oxidoreductase/NADH oxidase [Clostridia bacterium]
MKHETFHYENIEAIKAKFNEIGACPPVAENIGTLWDEVSLGAHSLKNRFVIQPMEGCDGTKAGAPDELTKRRYLRFAESGAGVIWFEAVAIVHEGRANPRQLYLSSETAEEFKKLIAEIKETAIQKHGFAPKIIMQATHSGRQSRPDDAPKPVIAYRHALYEKTRPIPGDECIASDDALKALEEKFAEATVLAQEVGFDGIDVKCCHGYLLNELLSAYTRPGLYGGSFENRTRLFRNGVDAAFSAAKGDFIVTSRLNIYDGFPYPFGFGVKEGEGNTPDLTEGMKLVGELYQKGMRLLNITAGNPYVNPHVNRPYDSGGYMPEEHPLEGILRMSNCTETVQKAYPDMVIVGSAFSYLRQFAPHFAAGAIENGNCTLAGFGRQSFAYPQFIEDLKKNGEMNPKKCCVSCSSCSKMMRMGTVAGCMVKDQEVYLPLYREAVAKQERGNV